MTFTLTREELYELVWSEPMQRLASQIGISDVAIAKQCRKLGIPVPERGYWNKLKAGKRVIRARLPVRDLVTISHVTISGELPPELRARLKSEPASDNESIEVLTERLRKRLGKVAVPRDFDRAYPAIATLLRKDEKLREENATRRYVWQKPRFDDPFERRRLLFLNGLFLGFAKVGGRGWLRGTEARELWIDMGNRSISFQLDKAGRGKSARRGASAVPDTRESLCLTIAHHDAAPGLLMQWQDEPGRPLEKQLTEIVIGMAVAGEHLHRRWLEQQAAWERQRQEEEKKEAQRRKEEAARREQERLAAMEKARIDRLRQDAKAWRDAANIRAYVEAVRMAVKGQTDAGALEIWSRWALTEADKLDPIASGRAFAPGEDVEGEAIKPGA